MRAPTAPMPVASAEIRMTRDVRVKSPRWSRESPAWPRERSTAAESMKTPIHSSVHGSGRIENRGMRLDRELTNGAGLTWLKQLFYTVV